LSPAALDAFQFLRRSHTAERERERERVEREEREREEREQGPGLIEAERLVLLQ